MDELSERLTGEKLIAVDTEFFRETSYFPQLALVQIATSSVLACIDPLGFDARPGLRQILLDRQIIKIFHSCSQDLEVLFYYLGEIPAPIHDTQIANAFLEEDHQISYASLVERELGIKLDKSQTRTNWLQRPLTGKQIRYAGDDVYYLYQLYLLLVSRLDEAGKKKWFEEECSTLTMDHNNYRIAVDTLWNRVKGARKLTRDKLAIVQSIAEWREQLARQKDKTRRKVIADDIIIQLALNPPDDLHLLARLAGSNSKFSNEQLQQLLDTIKSALQSSPDAWPDNRFSALDNKQKRLLKHMRQFISEKAEKLQVSEGILTSKKELEKLILYYAGKTEIMNAPRPDDCPVLRGWRLHFIGEQLLESIKNSE